MTDQAFILLVQTILALAVLAPVLLVAALSQISLFVPVTAEDDYAAPVTAPVAQSYPLRASLMLLAADLYVESLFLIGRFKATHTAAQHAWATS